MAIITITRGAKSGGIELAGEIAKRLGYTCLSREILVDSARCYNIEEAVLQAGLDDVPSLWQRMTRERERYLVFVRCALLRAAAKDRLVYHGHAGQFFLRDIRHVLKVRIEAPMDQRVRTVIQETSMTPEQALAHIHKVDDTRRRWVKVMYGLDWVDPGLYDLTVNLAHMSIRAAADICCHAIGRPDFETTEESLQHVRNLSLACEVRAALNADDQLWDLPLEVSADAGMVCVSGSVLNSQIRAAIEPLVRQVKGVRECKISVAVRADTAEPGGAARG